MLSVRDLSRPGLAPISLELADGECVAVVGASGSGKTLMLRAIADLDPNRGAIALDGVGRETMPAPEWRRLVVYVAAEPGWWTESVGGHFDDWDRASEMVAATGLPDNCREWPIARLSTGERQRLSLVRALVLEPRVLLLDEPTSGLDEAATRAVEQLVHGHLARGACALWVTHDPDQSRRLARRRLVCADGTVSESTP